MSWMKASFALMISLTLGLTGCGQQSEPVSYTHLTLPTSDLV